MADKIRDEQRRIRAMFVGRAHRPCEQCGHRVEMRQGQKFCSTYCRVSAHRERRRADPAVKPGSKTRSELLSRLLRPG
jgi:hypothetical protein